MAWLVRTSLLAAATAASFAIPTPAEACSPPLDLALFPHLDDGARTGVPTDGVIAFRADAHGELSEALALMTIEVTGDGLPVAGAIETIEINSFEDFGTRTDLFVVWRPESALAASSDYVASISVVNADDPEGEPSVTTLDITTAAGPAGTLPAVELQDVVLSAMPTGSGPRVCCDTGNSCGFPGCEALEQSERPVLAVELGTSDDPLAGQSYIRLLSGVDDALEPASVAGIAAEITGGTYQFSFDMVAGSYCAGAEVVSLIDGSVLPVVSVCEEHGDLELTTGPSPTFDAFLEVCVGEPYWEDTMEPYEPGGGTGDGDGGSGEGDGGSGSDADGGSDGDGGSADGDGDGDGDGGSADGGLDDDKGGCACQVDEGRSGWPALAGMLIFGAFVRRRRG